MRVHPTLIPRDHVLASVTEAYNAVYIHGNAVGNIMLYGMGAGMMPTGSAVVSDLIDIARDMRDNTPGRVPHLGFLPENLRDTPNKSIMDITTCYYFRFAAVDRPGVLSKIAGILGAVGSASPPSSRRVVRWKARLPIVMLTHEALERNVRKALEEIGRLEVVLAPTQVIRIENQETGILY